MKNQPTKKQLVDRLAHFEKIVVDLIVSLDSAEEDPKRWSLVEDLKAAIDNAPSITPVPKADSPVE